MADAKTMTTAQKQAKYNPEGYTVINNKENVHLVSLGKVKEGHPENKTFHAHQMTAKHLIEKGRAVAYDERTHGEIDAKGFIAKGKLKNAA